MWQVGPHSDGRGAFVETVRPGLDDLATLRAVWEGAADALVLSDPEGVVLAVNAAYCALYGFSPAELVGCSFALIFPEASRPNAESMYRETFRRGDVTPYESQVRRADGSQLTVEARVTYIERGGQAVAMLSTIRDITALRRAEADRDAVVASASHDLRQPLTLIRGRAELLLRKIGDDLTPAQLEKGLRSITVAIDNVTEQLTWLVDTVRLSGGQLAALNRQPVELTAWLRELVAMHQATTEEHQLYYDGPTGTLMAWIDELRMRRVVGNLLSNAIKYSPDGGNIRVGLSSDGSRAALEIEDWGIGIPAADVPHIFEPYHRARNVLGSTPGSGIGLTGALRIVRQHGGSLEVESIEGQGALFRLVIPLTPSLDVEELPSS